MDFSSAHLHLLLNHFPTVGFIVGLGLFIIAVAANSHHLKVGSLVTLFVISLMTIPVYITGSGAHTQVCGAIEVLEPCAEGGPNRGLIELHEGAAFVSLMWMQGVGLLAWLGLWVMRRSGRMPVWHTVLLLLVSFATVATVAEAANIGGEIRHPDIRVLGDVTYPLSEDQQPVSLAIRLYIQNTPWAWAAFEAIHMVGLSLVIGVVFLLNLKLLGFASLPYLSLDRMLPWGMLGFYTNAVTGMHFFVASPWFYVGNPSMNWKLVFLMAAGLTMLVFTLDQSWRREGEPLTRRAKALAASSLVLWIGVMFFGSMLPFLGQAF